MFHSFLKTAWRNLFKTKLPSFIHVVGLSLGLSCCLIIGLYIFEEFRYDRHFKDVKSLFQVVSYYKGDTDNTPTIETPAALGAELKNSFGEIEAVTRMLKTDKGFLFADHKAFHENIIFVDSAFLEVFQFDVIEGSKHNCLTNPHSIIVRT